MTLGIDKILEAIESYGDNYCQTVEDEAYQEAQKHYDNQIKLAKERNEERYERFVEEAAHEKRRKIARFETKSKQEVGEFKIQCINEVMQEVLNHFLTLSDEDFVKAVKVAMDSNNGDIKPRILVDKHHYDAVFKALGSIAQVVNSDDITNGFMLDFNDYDVNYEFEKVFYFNRENYAKRIMQYLFED